MSRCPRSLTGAARAETDLGQIGRHDPAPTARLRQVQGPVSDNPRMHNSATAERSRRAAVTALILYLVALALIAFWPEPVDRGAAGLLEQVRQVLPWATVSRIEFAANIALFVPYGWLLSILLARTTHLLLPIGMLTTFGIEAVQRQLLVQRTASLLDILANIAGFCIGMIIATILVRKRTGESS